MNVGYRSLLLIVILVFGLLSSLFYVAYILPDKPKAVIVIIPEEAFLEFSEHNNFEAATINVVIGVNNTVRWINLAVASASVVAFDNSDPDFFDATSTDENGLPRVLLNPGDTFEFTFTKPGVFDYHGVPHPTMQGTVIALEQ